MKQYKYYALITGIFTSSLIISNILDTKFFQVGQTILPCGIIIFPILYVFGDVLTEVYGFANSRKVIWTGFFSLMLFIVTLEIAKRLPAAGFWKNQQAFDLILGKVPRLMIASVVAYFCGEFINSWILALLKVRQNGEKMYLRFILSTIAGQAIDTSVFVLIAFVGTMDVKTMMNIILSGWSFKVVWEIIALPLSLSLVKWLKKEEKEDFYDIDTNFNPFKIQ